MNPTPINTRTESRTDTRTDRRTETGSEAGTHTGTDGRADASTGDIKVRNLRFDVHLDVPRHWLGGRKSVTSFFDNLSVFFPLGERFFIQAVAAHQRFVRDPQLRKDVRAFCGQEGIHSREHESYNDMLAHQGYPVRDMELQVQKLLTAAARATTKRQQLAFTCALEHFTALMAHTALENDVFAGAHPTMGALWKWHAVEENEHRAVAFDVYRAAGGTYGERVRCMVLASVIFWAKVLEHQIRLMRCDGTVFSLREWAQLGWFLFGKPGWLRQIIPLYLHYFRPSFHPHDLDCTAAMERWKREYATSEVYRKAA
ncbi:metal-dependent hydrolase [Pendulispora albinea]|uniref:Metal-dependent hydrolase n=1 Tax=Pendulispora albinea TaxID=2741071 RepID=A0ABZ2MBU5_9BACT